jgi:AcrR family transcriptional regulator
MATTQVRYSAANRREQIVEVATRLFADQGFQGTTTRQVAEHSGVTEALIFRHFRGKEDLYWAVIEQKIRAAGPAARMRERLERSGSDMTLLASVAAEILERRAKDQTLSRLLLYSALENHRLSNRFFRIYVAECYEVLAEYVQKRIAEGNFRPIDPLLAARGFLGMVIYHSWVQELFGGKRYQNFSVQQVSETLAQLWLKGMQNKPEIPNGSSGRDEKHSDPPKHVRKNGNR